ncbi:hypothetical protein SDC9_84553 [bioreactor metagenome]|uniref:Uncharacterized protein n=1 Tax=bioreactor metagenome TaxID=1076179 RepID=A0A644ZDG0_9ZZZZ
MYKRRVIIIFCCLLFVSFTGCACKHEWISATCTELATCAKCGETEGEPIRHDWILATCKDAKTCSRCGQIEGEPLGHVWIPATCEDAKTCSRCGLSEGEPLGHDWVEATHNDPKTCNRCDETYGGRLPYQWNVTVDEKEIRRGFYHDDNNYWFEVSSDVLDTYSLLTLFKYDGWSGFLIMEAAIDDVTAGAQKHEVKNGMEYWHFDGNSKWIFYADVSGGVSGRFGLKVNNEDDLRRCFSGEIVD